LFTQIIADCGVDRRVVALLVITRLEMEPPVPVNIKDSLVTSSGVSMEAAPVPVMAMPVAVRVPE
jgi:hypothetical protein